MPADIRTVVDPLPFGMPTGCTGCSCSGNCGGDCGSCSSGCGDSGDQSLAPVPLPQAVGADTPWTSCPGGGWPSYRGVVVGDALDAIAALARRAPEEASHFLDSAEACENTGATSCRMKVTPGTPVPTG